jgi:hypothetical protein
VYWYAPGSSADSLWFTTGIGKLTPSPARQVKGTYVPISGDFDGDWRRRHLLVREGSATDNLWTATPSGFVASVPSQVKGTYTRCPATSTATTAPTSSGTPPAPAPTTSGPQCPGASALGRS